jgi:hypothetical protein
MTYTMTWKKKFGAVGLKRKESHRAFLPVCFSPDMHFEPEDGGRTFHQNVVGLVPHYMALRPTIFSIVSAFRPLLAAFLFGLLFHSEDGGSTFL